MVNVLVQESSLQAIADAIREKTGVQETYTPGQMAEAIEEISGGGIIPTGEIEITSNGTYDITNYASAEVDVSSSSTDPPYHLGGRYANSNYVVEVLKNHVKITANASPTNVMIGLRDFQNTNCPKWFTIEAGSTVTVEYKNVVNTKPWSWAANFKGADSDTSLSYSTGDGTHLNGETVTHVQETTVDVGCLFVYISMINSGYSLEFDVEITIDGERIL